MVHAKATPAEAGRKNFRERAYDLFAEWVYDEAGFDDAEAFNFDIDDEIAPHFGWPILHDTNFIEFDPVAQPELLGQDLTTRTFGNFIRRLAKTTELPLEPDQPNEL